MTGAAASAWIKPDWKPVEPFPFNAARKSFTGPTSDEGLVSLKYFQASDGALRAIASFGPQSEGAPGQVHGGMILTVLDEALGAAAWLAGHPVLTVRLQTEFRMSVPVRTNMLVTTHLARVRHKLVFVEGELLGADGKRYAGAKGEFLELSPDAQRRVFGRTHSA